MFIRLLFLSYLRSVLCFGYIPHLQNGFSGCAHSLNGYTAEMRAGALCLALDSPGDWEEGGDDGAGHASDRFGARSSNQSDA